MANTLKIKRGLAASIPQGQLAEPLFTTDTYDLYIGKGSGGNQRIQNYIASGTSSQFLKGDGTLDSTTYQATSEKGQNNGYASLDSGGKVPAAQLPNSIMDYKGTWDASTNTPTLADGTGNAGDVYICSVGGTQNLGSGSITFAAGDWVVYSGSVWQKSINSNAVASVNGQTGAVVLYTDDISEDGSPTNLWFTNARARTALSATSPVQYNNSTGVISILDASASQSGVVTTATQTFAGNKTFSDLLYGNQHIYFGMSTGADYYVRTPNVSTSRRGLFLSNGVNTDLKVYAGGTQTLGAWTESDTTLVIGTGYQGGGGSAETILFHSTGIGNMLALSAANSRIYAYLPITGSSSITATSFVKSGGTSAQFLKADGSVDSNTYLTTSSAASTYLPLAGGTLTGALSGTSSSMSSTSTATAFIPTGSSVPTNGMYLPSANTVAISANSTKVIQISDSGRMSIGATTPTTDTLTVHGAITTTNGGTITAAGGLNAGSTIFGGLNCIITSDLSAASITPTGSTAPVTGMYLPSSGAIGFSTSTTPRVTISSGGNVGFSNSTPKNLIDIAGKGGFSINVNDIAFSNNLYLLNGDWKRQSTNAGSSVYLSGGEVYFYRSSAGGSVDGAVTTTQSMIINSSGNVGIGVNPTVTNGVTELALGSSNTNPRLSGIRDGANAYIIYSDSGGTDFYERRNLYLRFGANNTEFMRITNGGNVLIGTTSDNGGKLQVSGGDVRVSGGVRFSSSGADANRWSVYWNGGTGDLIVVNNISDIRAKKDFDYNIKGLETIQKLKPLKFTWKDGTSHSTSVSGRLRQYGFIAQETMEADDFLAWYNESQDSWGIEQYESFSAVIVKAIQEQQAQIEELKSKL